MLRAVSGRGWRTVVAGWVFAIGAAAPAAEAADSRVRTWPSPDRHMVMSSVKEGSEDELGYQLKLIRPGQVPVVVDEYDRDVDVFWSADSRYVAVTDWIGSNVADCYIVDAERREQRIDVTDTLPKIHKDVGNSHFYVSCVSWWNPTTIAVEAAGHTDYPPIHDFKYRFVLDVSTGRIVGRW